MNHIVQLGKLQAGGIKVLEALEGVEKILSSSVNLGHCLARDVWPPCEAAPEQILVEDGLFPSLGGTGSEWVFFAFVFVFLSSNKSPHEKKSQILTPHLLFLFFLPFNFVEID